MISWDLLKRVYGFVGDTSTEDKEKELDDKKSLHALKRYIDKEPLDEIAKSIGMILPSKDQVDFFLDNLRYYEHVSDRQDIPVDRILSNSEIISTLEIFSDSVLIRYYKGEYKSRRDLVRLCSIELSKRVKVFLPHSQISLYADKKVIRIDNESGHNYYRVKDVYSLLLKNPDAFSKDIKDQLFRCISDKFIQWGQSEDGLVDLHKLLLY